MEDFGSIMIFPYPFCPVFSDGALACQYTGQKFRVTWLFCFFKRIYVARRDSIFSDG